MNEIMDVMIDSEVRILSVNSHFAVYPTKKWNNPFWSGFVCRWRFQIWVVLLLDVRQQRLQMVHFIAAPIGLVIYNKVIKTEKQMKKKKEISIVSLSGVSRFSR
mmetsp:Transcript_31653/g.52827  ORF Transcript_31653/g.52827 Transcript_31653/m.52827 type:complete len:104 (+) Transcript_31653:164-475(+)